MLTLIGTLQCLLDHFKVIVGLLPEPVAFNFEIVVKRLRSACQALCFFAKFQPLRKVIGPALSRTCIFFFLVELAD